MAKIGLNGCFLGGQPSEEISSTFGSIDFTVLDEETSPAAVARDQRRDVLNAYRNGHRNAETISKFLWLELWVVQRRMHELGIGPPAHTKIASRTKSSSDVVVPKIVEMLIELGPQMAKAIAQSAGVPVQSCLSILRTSDRFEMYQDGMNGKKKRFLWRLKVGQSVVA